MFVFEEKLKNSNFEINNNEINKGKIFENFINKFEKQIFFVFDEKLKEFNFEKFGLEKKFDDIFKNIENKIVLVFEKKLKEFGFEKKISSISKNFESNLQDLKKKNQMFKNVENDNLDEEIKKKKNVEEISNKFLLLKSEIDDYKKKNNSLLEKLIKNEDLEDLKKLKENLIKKNEDLESKIQRLIKLKADTKKDIEKNKTSIKNKNIKIEYLKKELANLKKLNSEKKHILNKKIVDFINLKNDLEEENLNLGLLNKKLDSLNKRKKIIKIEKFSIKNNPEKIGNEEFKSSFKKNDNSNFEIFQTKNDFEKKNKKIQSKGNLNNDDIIINDDLFKYFKNNSFKIIENAGNLIKIQTPK